MSSGTATAGRPVLRWWVIPAVLIALSAGIASLVTAPQAALAASQGAASISAGGYDSCAIESGQAYCWGSNYYGQLGDGSPSGSSIPVAVDTSGALAGKTLTQITVGYGQTCALDTTGAAYCWGWNPYGELGDGSTADSSVPVAVDTEGVLAGKTLTQITAGGYQTCALDSAGAAYCWGYNADGELGDGSTTDSSVPVAVDTEGVLAGKTLTQITAGGYQTCALDSTGAAYCWGGGSGVPVAVDSSGVLAGKTLTQITVGWAHTCALDSTGAAYCWGYNADGQLGDGSTTDSSVPVAVDSSGVLAGKILTQITAGDWHTCAVDAAGAAYCWGNDAFGELGDGSTTASSVPVAVEISGVLAGRTLTQITGGLFSSCAVDAAGAAYCWGDDRAGAPSDVPALIGPQAPTAVTAVPGDATATVSWTAPASLDGGTLTGFTATAAPGGAACATTGGTTCTITGLANGTRYSVAVVADTTAGDSGASVPATVTPAGGPAFTSNAAVTAAFGVAFSFTVTTTGHPAPKISRTGRLPSGVAFARNGNGTATISGIPSHGAAGVYPLRLTAKNSAGTATQAFSLTITRAPAIKKIPATTTRAGVPLNLTIKAAGYPVPALTESGALPAGLSFTDNGNGTATIGGTPAAGSGGRYSITVTAANQSGTAGQTFTLRVK